jgi:hypothetical protein
LNYAGYIQSTKVLVEKGATLNVKNAKGWTPLHFAAKKGDPDFILMLIDWGADVNIQNLQGRLPSDLASSKVRTLFDPEGDNFFRTTSSFDTWQRWKKEKKGKGSRKSKWKRREEKKRQEG